MKVFAVIAKVVAALAAIAGIVYIVATYGDKIVAWAKKMLGGHCCCGCCEDVAEDAIEEVPAGDDVAEEPAEEAPVQDETVASDADFEG